MVFKKLFKILKNTFGFKKKTIRKKKANARKKSCKTKTRSRIKSSHAKKSISRKSKKPVVKRIKKLKVTGIITHYFPNVNAAVVKLKSPLCLGDVILVKGKTGEFRQTVGSMQIDRKPIEKGRKGQEIGLEIFKRVSEGDAIYRIGS